jgi:hypothetical protein
VGRVSEENACGRKNFSLSCGGADGGQCVLSSAWKNIKIKISLRHRRAMDRPLIADQINRWQGMNFVVVTSGGGKTAVRAGRIRDPKTLADEF